MNWIDKLERRYGNLGIPNLINGLLIGQLAAGIIMLFFNRDFGSLLMLSRTYVLHGQIWRLITFLFVPIWLGGVFGVLNLLFYYWLGNALARVWGDFRTTLFLVTVDLGIPVICYGLRADFMMRGFPGSTRLLEIAHTIEELKTICACGRKAICNGRKVNGEFVFEGAQVAIDTVDDVEYQSLCPQCWYREYRAFLARHPKK